MSADHDPRDLADEDTDARDTDARDTEDEGVDDDPEAVDDEPEAVDDESADDEDAEPGPPPAWRTPALVATRAVVVVVVAVVGYLLVVPQTHVDRDLQRRLTITGTGLAAFPGKAAQAQSEPVATSGIKSLVALAKTHPDATGIWVAQWNGSGATAADATAVVTFLAPTSADATKVVADLKPQTIDEKSTNQSFTRSASYTTPGIPGSAGALFTNSAAQAGQPSRLASILWQQGKVVALVEEIAGTGTQVQAERVAGSEAALLRSQERGFTLKVTTHPTGPTLGWIGGSLVVLLLVAGGPVLVGRVRRRREEERRALLESQVPGHIAIAKRRRNPGS